MHSQMNNQLDELVLRLRSFSEQRDWCQFHNPKNLVMALSGEVGELAEIFQWLTIEQSNELTKESLSEASKEIADVFLYLLRLSDVLGVNLLSAAFEKMDINEQKYPIELSKGNAKKYTQL